MPSSSALSMMAKESFSSVCGPKFIVPRHSRETFRPVRPSCVYSMFASKKLVNQRSSIIAMCAIAAAAFAGRLGHARNGFSAALGKEDRKLAFGMLSAAARAGDGRVGLAHRADGLE